MGIEKLTMQALFSSAKDLCDLIWAFMVPNFFKGCIGHSHLRKGCGNTMPVLSDLVPFHSGQVENFNLLVLGKVQNLYKVNRILYFIF